MGFMAHMVALKAKKALCLGDLIKNEDGKIVDFGLSENEEDPFELKSVIYNFIKDHVFDDVRLMTDKEYDELDLSEIEVVNKDYGMSFLNPDFNQERP